MVVYGQSGCIREKVDVFGEKWLYSGKCGYIPSNSLYLGKSGCARAE